MKRFVFRVVTLATFLVLVLPFSGMAMDDAPVKPLGMRIKQLSGRLNRSGAS